MVVRHREARQLVQCIGMVFFVSEDYSDYVVLDEDYIYMAREFFELEGMILRRHTLRLLSRLNIRDGIMYFDDIKIMDDIFIKPAFNASVQLRGMLISSITAGTKSALIITDEGDNFLGAVGRHVCRDADTAVCAKLLLTMPEFDRIQE